MTGEYMKEKRYDALTSLKGIFIIGIAIMHFYTEVGRPYDNILNPIFNMGWYYGNRYFFMVSGFLMCLAYRDRISGQQTDIAGFVYGRLKKIWPLHILTNAFVLLCIIAMSHGWREEFELKMIISTGLMITSGWIEDVFPYNFPTWFICVLLLCYLIFYVISKLYGKHRDLYYVALICMIAWGYILEIKEWSFPFCYHNDGIGFFNFFTGVLVFDLVSLLQHKLDKAKLRAVRIAGLLVLIALHILFVIYGIEEVCGDTQFVATLFVLPILLMLATAGGVAERVLACRPLVAVGNSSMYIFYFHVPVITVYSIVNYYKGYTIRPEEGIIAYVLAIAAICICFTVYDRIRAVRRGAVKERYDR